jgi:hypothetical protein
MMGRGNYRLPGIPQERAAPDDMGMECTLCEAMIDRCGSCGSWSCSTSLCSRCTGASPDAHETFTSVGISVGLSSAVILLDGSGTVSHPAGR